MIGGADEIGLRRTAGPKLGAPNFCLTRTFDGQLFGVHRAKSWELPTLGKSGSPSFGAGGYRAGLGRGSFQRQRPQRREELGAPNFQSTRKFHATGDAFLGDLSWAFDAPSGGGWELPTFKKRPLPSSGDKIDRECLKARPLQRRDNCSSAPSGACSFVLLSGAPNASGRHIINAGADLGDDK